ncbi:MAG: radical SAM protein [Planctomycetia bacterium 21-64-5]|nr:MAG: radical SAM protein [Planctomycetia bacterium 21-64-5]HQU41872.1 7-carboxy-7-deazaguanine synthase QueE [Pirellulales bacterium]
MRIAEIYLSIQGEGLLTGAESVFVRASGCNLRCWFCDTPFASWSPEGEDLSVPEILDRVDEYHSRHVVLTGGEPMLFAELIPLADELHQRGLHITIETAGTLDLPVACDLMSISPKLSNSAPKARTNPRWHRRHEQTRHAPDVVRRLVRDYPYQVKFVIDQPSDCREVEAYLRSLPEIARSRVLLMPQGTDAEQLARRGQWLREYCEGAGVRFCPRRQIEWFGLLRGT